MQTDESERTYTGIPEEERALSITSAEGEDLHSEDDDDDAGARAAGAASAAETARPWRVAKSLLTLREQINKAFPKRSKASDGTIGDPAHQSRNSDHNAWVVDGSSGVVTALDITHDPSNGCDAGKLAETLRASKDARIKYIISNARISSPVPKNGKPAWAWRPYTGTNPHRKHFHVSVQPEKAKYDSTATWKI